MAFQTFDYHSLLWSVTTILNSDGTTAMQLMVANPPAAQVTTVLLSSDDTVDRFVKIGIDGIADFGYFMTVKVPAGAGTDGVQLPINLFDFLPANTLALVLPNTDSLYAGMVTAMTSGKKMSIYVAGGQF